MYYDIDIDIAMESLYLYL